MTAQPRSEGVTHAEAAAIGGCGTQTIDRHQRSGDIARRYEADRKLPSLNRVSVEAFAERWQRAQLEKKQYVPKYLREYGPPRDGDVWLETATAALVVGVTPQYLARLARQERIPATSKPGRRRLSFRRSDVEKYAPARAFESRLDEDHRLPA